MTPSPSPVRDPARWPARGLAAIIAVTAWTGLALDAIDVSSRSASVLETIWILADYFTILTNLLVAVTFTHAALRGVHEWAAGILGGLALSILLVGIVYHLLLRGLYVLTPIAQAGDVLLHEVTPVLVPLFWLLFCPKGRLTLRDPLAWALYPLVYFGYAILRGGVTGHYPYPFMNVAKIGWALVLQNAAAIAFGFVVTGCALVWLDGMLAGRAAPRTG